MNAEEASALAREYAARMVKLIPNADQDTEAFLHAAFMQGWSMERRDRQARAKAIRLSVDKIREAYGL